MSKSEKKVSSGFGLVPQFEEVRNLPREREIEKLKAEVERFRNWCNASHEKVMAYERGRYLLKDQLRDIEERVRTLRTFCRPEVNDSGEIAVVHSMVNVLLGSVKNAQSSIMFGIEEDLPF